MDSQRLAEELAEATLELCRIPSVTGDEAAIADYLEGLCTDQIRSPFVRRIGNTVVARGAVRAERPTVALFGHLDTVRPAAVQRLEIDAAAGKVYGCGASDMKGALAVMLKILAGSDDERRANLLCVFYDKEEGPADDSGIIAICEDAATWLAGVELALCLEPTDGRIQAGCVGGLHARVIAHGKRAHSARPWQGENAIYAAIPLLTRLRDVPRREVTIEGLTFYEVISATQAATDNSRNVIPEKLVLNVNYRFAPGKPTETAIRELSELIGSGYSVEIIDISPAGAVCLSAPRLRRWMDAAGLVVEAKQAWTDVARLAAIGLAAVNFGPGATAQAHQADEWVRIDALAESHRLLEALLRS